MFLAALFLRGLSTMTPRASFSCFERRGGGGGDRKNTSRSIRGGSRGLSRVVAEGMHQILILLTAKFCPGLLYVSHFISSLCIFIEEEILSAAMSSSIVEILAQELGGSNPLQTYLPSGSVISPIKLLTMLFAT